MKSLLNNSKITLLVLLSLGFSGLLQAQNAVLMFKMQNKIHAVNQVEISNGMVSFNYAGDSLTQIKNLKQFSALKCGAEVDLLTEPVLSIDTIWGEIINVNDFNTRIKTATEDVEVSNSKIYALVFDTTQFKKNDYRLEQAKAYFQTKNTINSVVKLQSGDQMYIGKNLVFLNDKVAVPGTNNNPPTHFNKDEVDEIIFQEMGLSVKPDRLSFMESSEGKVSKIQLVRVDDDELVIALNGKRSRTIKHTKEGFRRIFFHKFGNQAQAVSPLNGKVRLAINAMYGYRSAPVYNTGSSDLNKHLLRLKHGLGLDLDLQYYLKKNYGLGLKYNLHYASSESTIIQGKITDQVYIHYVGPSFFGFYKLESLPGIVFTTVSAGAIIYQNDGTIEGGENLDISAATFAWCCDVKYEIPINNKTAFNVGLGYVIGSFSSAYYNNTKVDLLEQENASHLDFKLGLTYYFN